MSAQQEINWKQIEDENEKDAELLQDDLTDEELLELSNRVEDRFVLLTKNYKASDSVSEERKSANSSVRALRNVLGDFDLAKFKANSKLGARELDSIKRITKSITEMPFRPDEEEKVRDLITGLVFKDGRRYISEDHPKIVALRQLYRDTIALNTLRYLSSNERTEKRDKPVIERLQSYMAENSLSANIAKQVDEQSI